MAVVRLTPTVGVTSLFGVAAPFVVGAKVIYKVAAVRRFTEVIGRGDDIYQNLYVPNGISETDYEAHLAADACLVTLQPDYGAPILVPDTYITTFTNNDVYRYTRRLATIDLGPLPSDVDITYLETMLAANASDLLGVDGVVKWVEIPVSDTVTPEQHNVNEATRKAKIKTRTTIYAENVSLKAQNANLLDTQKRLIELLEQNGITP